MYDVLGKVVGQVVLGMLCSARVMPCVYSRLLLLIVPW